MTWKIITQLARVFSNLVCRTVECVRNLTLVVLHPMKAFVRQCIEYAAQLGNTTWKCIMQLARVFSNTVWRIVESVRNLISVVLHPAKAFVRQCVEYAAQLGNMTWKIITQLTRVLSNSVCRTVECVRNLISIVLHPVKAFALHCIEYAAELGNTTMKIISQLARVFSNLVCPSVEC